MPDTRVHVGAAARVVLQITTVPSTLMFLHGQIGFLQERGWRVHVLSSAGASLQSFGSRERVTVHTADFTRRYTPLRDLRALVQTVRVIRDIRPAIIQAQTPKAALIGLLAGALAGSTVRIYYVRGLPLETARGLQRVLLRCCERVTCWLAHAVVCDSVSLQQVMLSEGLCAPDKAGTLGGGIGGGIDAEHRFNPTRVTGDAGRAIREQYGVPLDAMVVGYVGRLARDKGLTELEKCWRRLLLQHPAAHLLIVGALDARAPVEASTIQSLSALPGVHLAGRVDDPAPYYAAMNVVVLPTYREGMGYVALEAAAMGLPVVATRTTGCVDAVSDGVTGVLVEPRSANALAGALDRYMRDPVLREQHGSAGRARMLKDFRQARAWEACHALYNRLLADHGRVALPPVQPGLVKRCFNVIGASVLLVLTAPLLAFAALAIRSTMGAPVIFRQRRAGLLGRAFTLHKFRTMSDARAADGQLLPIEQRLTRLGRWLRATSIDELPQLWDVLRGDMSMVGPRPLLQDYLPLYNAEQGRRHLVKPGLTGWAQVNGRNALSWDEKFALDVWYVEHASLWLDLRILLRTLPRVLRHDGVSPPNRVVMETFHGN